MFSKAAIGSIHKHDHTKCTQHTNTIEFRKKEMKSRELWAGWGFFSSRRNTCLVLNNIDTMFLSSL